jgi:hypothetical protein
MNVREAMIAALRRDPDLLSKVAAALRGRKEESDGPSAVVRAAEALEPIIADAVRKNPSKLNRLGLKSATILASLAAEDRKSNSRLGKIARGSTVGIIFVDVAGFAGFTERNGDEEANALIGRVSEIVDSKVAASNGECVKHLGDGFLLVCPPPPRPCGERWTSGMPSVASAGPTHPSTLVCGPRYTPANP